MRVLMVLAGVVMFANAAHAGQEVLLEAGGAAGVAHALHGDLGFSGAAASGTARVRVSPHVAIEAQVGYWQHRERDRFLAQQETVDTSTRYRFPSVTLNVLAVSTRDAPVGPYGGAGVGVFYQLKRYEQSGTAAFPPYARSDVRVTLGAGFVGGVDVRVARRLKTFGEVRFDVQSFQDPGASSVRVFGGVRVPIG